MTRDRRIVLALGSNLGDRTASLQRGLDILAAEPGLACEAVSSVYETSPVGGPDQPDYLNAVLIARSALPARAILARCQAAERALGRERTTRWGPRTLDIDVIMCGDETSTDPGLTLPHPRAAERGFVLLPWLEIDPEASIPGRGPVASLLADAGSAKVRRLTGVVLRLDQSAGERLEGSSGRPG